MLKAVQRAEQKAEYWAMHWVVRTDSCLVALKAAQKANWKVV
jgi:methenyltetrahydromethanopterin cyclohydrolase